MAVTKPTVTPDWVSDGNAAIVDPDTAVILDPGGTLRASGWAVQEKPAAQHVNWLFRIIWTWIRWLQDIESQAITWTAVHVFNSGLTLGTPDVKHTSREHPLPAGSGINPGGYWTLLSTPGAGGPVYWISPGGGSLRDLVFPVPLAVGDRLVGVVAHIKDHNAAGVMALKLFKTTSAGVGTQIGSTVNSANNGTDQLLTMVDGVPQTMATGIFYNVTITSDTGSNDQRVYGVTLIYDRV